MAPHSVDDLARSFERHLRTRNKSPRTIETYLQAVGQFAAHLKPNRKANGGRGLADARGEGGGSALSRPWLAIAAGSGWSRGSIVAIFKGPENALDSPEVVFERSPCRQDSRRERPAPHAHRWGTSRL